MVDKSAFERVNTKTSWVPLCISPVRRRCSQPWWATALFSVPLKSPGSGSWHWFSLIPCQNRSFDQQWLGSAMICSFNDCKLLAFLKPRREIELLETWWLNHNESYILYTSTILEIAGIAFLFCLGQLYAAVFDLYGFMIKTYDFCSPYLGWTCINPSYLSVNTQEFHVTPGCWLPSASFHHRVQGDKFQCSVECLWKGQPMAGPNETHDVLLRKLGSLAAT